MTYYSQVEGTVIYPTTTTTTAQDGTWYVYLGRDYEAWKGYQEIQRVLDGWVPIDYDGIVYHLDDEPDD